MSIKRNKKLDPESLRAARKARIAARRRALAKEDDDKEEEEEEEEEEDDKKKSKDKKQDKDDEEEDEKDDKESEGKGKSKGKKSVESAFNYNPLYKPTHLGGDQAPRGGYHYFGPPPDAGTSYGLFTTASGNGVIAPVGDDTSDVYDPETGKTVKMESKADKDVTSTILAARDELVTLPPCPGCKESRLTSAAIVTKGFKSIYCVACGSDITEKVQAMKSEFDKSSSASSETQFEVLSSPDTFDSVVESDVNMTLFNEDESNPFWNVDIKGMPVARVYLQDQPKPDETRAVFVSEQYYSGVSGGISKLGVDEVLSKINARRWVNAIDESQKVQDLKGRVQAEYAEQYEEKVNGFRDRLLSCVAIVCAGMDKNFWREEGNPLKEELYASFRKLGVPGNSVTASIEEAFSNGSTKYFEAVLNKGIDLMEKDDQVIAQIADSIGEANVLKPETPSAEGSDLPLASDAEASEVFDPTTASTLSDRLKQSSVTLSSFAGSTPGSKGYSTIKDTMKKSLRLGGASLK